MSAQPNLEQASSTITKPGVLDPKHAPNPTTPLPLLFPIPPQQ
jgi:hypothetical protein